MKPTLPLQSAAAFAALTVLSAFSGAAQAQSSVTLSGLLDTAVTRVKGAAGGVNAADVTLKRLDNGPMSTSRFSLLGSEDLGGGLAASFELSSFIRVDTGETGRSGPVAGVQADPFWARNAWVGLGSRAFGRVRLGLFATPMWLQSLNSNAFGDSTVVSPINIVTFIGSPLSGGTGWTNQVGYETPNLSGFTAAGTVSASENSGGRNTGLRAGYASGPLAVAGAWQDVKKNPTTFAEGTSANYTKAWQLMGSYDFGVAKVWAHLGNIQNNGTEAAPLSVGYRIWDLSANIPLGPGSVLVGYASRKTGDAVAPVAATAAGGNKERQVFTAGYDYFLSKRTDIYAMLLNDRTRTNTLPAPGTLTSASANNLYLGLRVRF